MDSLSSQARSRLSSSPRRGFNLIEAAIVLGVVGLVIGGIWVGASAVNQQHKVSQTVTAILSIADGTLNLFDSRSLRAIGAGVGLSAPLCAAGIIPSSWKPNTPSSCGGGAYISEEGASIWIRTMLSPQPGIIISLFGPGHGSAPSKFTTADCRRIAISIFNSVGKTGEFIQFSGDGGVQTAPFDAMLAADTQCIPNFTGIHFWFKAKT